MLHLPASLTSQPNPLSTPFYIEILVFSIFIKCAKLDPITYPENLTNMHFISMKKNNRNTLPSVIIFYNFLLKFFTVEKDAKTLYRVSPCTLVSVPANIALCPCTFVLKSIWNCLKLNGQLSSVLCWFCQGSNGTFNLSFLLWALFYSRNICHLNFTCMFQLESGIKLSNDWLLFLIMKMATTYDLQQTSYVN